MNWLWQDKDKYNYSFIEASISQVITTSLWALLLFIPLIEVSVCIICMHIRCCCIIMFCIPITVDEGFVE